MAFGYKVLIHVKHSSCFTTVFSTCSFYWFWLCPTSLCSAWNSSVASNHEPISFSLFVSSNYFSRVKLLNPTLSVCAQCFFYLLLLLVLVMPIFALRGTDFFGLIRTTNVLVLFFSYWVFLCLLVRIQLLNPTLSVCAQCFLLAPLTGFVYVHLRSTRNGVFRRLYSRSNRLYQLVIYAYIYIYILIQPPGLDAPVSNINNRFLSLWLPAAEVPTSKTTVRSAAGTWRTKRIK